MVRWEYRVIPMFSDPSPAEIDHMNRLGQEGWELVTLTSRNGTTAYAVFKRPIEDTESEVQISQPEGPQVMPW